MGKLIEMKSQQIETYFAQADTPAAGSPVGTTMVKVLAKFPGITFEEAREKAKEILNLAARARNYVGPRVFSEQEQIERRAQLKRAFGHSRAENVA
jgi:hypothetical protein